MTYDSPVKVEYRCRESVPFGEGETHTLRLFRLGGAIASRFNFLLMLFAHGSPVRKLIASRCPLTSGDSHFEIGLSRVLLWLETGVTLSSRGTGAVNRGVGAMILGDGGFGACRFTEPVPLHVIGIWTFGVQGKQVWKRNKYANKNNVSEPHTVGKIKELCIWLKGQDSRHLDRKLRKIYPILSLEHLLWASGTNEIIEFQKVATFWVRKFELFFYNVES